LAGQTRDPEEMGGMGIRLLPLQGKAVALLDYLLSCLSISFQDIITCGYRINEKKTQLFVT